MTWFRCGGSGIPAALKSQMNDVLNKKFGTSIDYPPQGWPDDVNLMGPLPEGTASGSIVIFSDGADDVPTKSLVVTIAPTLDGVSAVSEKHTGKNLFDKSAVTANTWIIVNSTATEPTNSYSTSDYIPVKANTRYYVSFKDSNRSAYYDKNKNGIAYFSFNGNASFKALYDGFIRITIKNDIDLDTFIVNEGNTVEPYEPFGETYTASLGRTIYGGTVDVVKGEGQDGYSEKIDMGTLNWRAGSVSGGDGVRFYCYFDDIKRSTAQVNEIVLADGYDSVTAYDTYRKVKGVASDTGSQRVVLYDGDYSTIEDFKQAVSGRYLIYPLATPTDFTFSPIEINSRLGNNTMWSDGDMSVTYRRDIDLALQALSGSRGLMMARPPAIDLANGDQGSEESTENNIETEGEQDAR